jgi:hypothetical protein
MKARQGTIALAALLLAPLAVLYAKRTLSDAPIV